MKHLITPTTPYSFVADGLAIGGITSYGEPLEPFALAMNVAHEFHAVPVPERIRGCPFISLELDDCDEIYPFVPTILRAVEYVRYVHRTGRQVLVTCAQGRNRSGIVVAEYLVQLGNPPASVVEKIQARRKNALTNEAFVKWLHRRR